jgi:carbamoyl-phosphate synthase small subunit
MLHKLQITSTTKSHRNRSQEGDFFITKHGELDLADGKTFSGEIPDWQDGPYFGEVVFNTGMTGYVESLTDPSYSGQILVFTYPLIGNYGVQLKAIESPKIQVSGVVVSEAASNTSHSGADLSFIDWLKSQNIPIIIGVDTRALTKYLRTRGTMAGALSDKPTNKKDIKSETKFVTID